jgi:hypothetical protein
LKGGVFQKERKPRKREEKKKKRNDCDYEDNVEENEKEK